MCFPKDKLIIVRGGGDLASGTIHRLVRCGFPVLVLETARPSAIRRQVAFSEAVYDQTASIEGVTCQLAEDFQQARQVMSRGQAALLIDESCNILKQVRPWALIDGILAKRNLGTTRDMADKTIALGPGFTAGADVDLVIETKRGHDLGRIITSGQAAANTGIPGLIGGYGKERVIHAPGAGKIQPLAQIGDHVEQGQVIAWILPEEDRKTLCCPPSADKEAPFCPPGSDKEAPFCPPSADREKKIPVTATLTGLLRGMIREGYPVTKGFKIADIDPRETEYKNCFTISDKARCIAGSVLEGLLFLDQTQHPCP